MEIDPCITILDEQLVFQTAVSAIEMNQMWIRRAALNERAIMQGFYEEASG